MQPITVYHFNAIDQAALSGGAWHATLSLEKLREPRPRLKAQSVDLQLASTQFRMALAGPKTTLGLQLISTNLSNAALYRVTWYSSDTFALEIGSTGWVNIGSSINWTNSGEWLEWEDPNFWLGAEAFIDPDNLGRDIRVRFANPTTLQFIKVELDDIGNTEGVVRIGHVYVGTSFVPSINFLANSFTRDTNTRVRTAVNGTRYYSRQAAPKRLAIGWETLPSMEVLGEMDDIANIHGADRPVYVDVNPEDTGSTGEKTAFLATLERMPEVQLQSVFFDNDIGASAGFEFTQVL